MIYSLLGVIPVELKSLHSSWVKMMKDEFHEFEDLFRKMEPRLISPYLDGGIAHEFCKSLKSPFVTRKDYEVAKCLHGKMKDLEKTAKTVIHMHSILTSGCNPRFDYSFRYYLTIPDLSKSHVLQTYFTTNEKFIEQFNEIVFSFQFY